MDNYKKDTQLFAEFLEEETKWKNISSKYAKNKIWARVPKNFDYIKDIRGKLIVKVYEYEMDKKGNPINESEKLKGVFSGPNMVVKWAKIPISFLLAGWKFKVGNAWETVNNTNVCYGYGGRGAGRTRGIKSGTIDTYYDPPLLQCYQVNNYDNNYLDVSTIVENNNILLWNPYNTKPGYAQFPFFPTKMRFGDLIEGKENLITEESVSISAFVENAGENYERLLINSADNYAVYENEVVDDNVNKIKKFDFSGTKPKLRPFIYVVRDPAFSENLYIKEEIQNIVDTKSMYIAKSIATSTLNSIVFNVVMPQYPVGTPYPYDNVLIQQAELRCDAGTYDLIEGIDFSTTWYNSYASNMSSKNPNYVAYYTMKEGITYAIRTIPAVKKSANNKLVFSWVLYL